MKWIAFFDLFVLLVAAPSYAYWIIRDRPNISWFGCSAQGKEKE